MSDPRLQERAFRFAAATTLALVLVACGADASGDDPPKSRSRIVADACHSAYSTLQDETPDSLWQHSDENSSSYAYLVAFTAEYCEAER